MTYIFRCSICGYVVETHERSPEPTCTHTDLIGAEYVKLGEPDPCVMQRDYQAENVGIGSGVKISRAEDRRKIGLREAQRLRKKNGV